MKFQSIPSTIDAVQFFGANHAECLAFCPAARTMSACSAGLVIQTPQADVPCAPGDWIAHHPDGSFSVIHDAQFRASFIPPPTHKVNLPLKPFQ
jgi:hypothetical protein